MKASMLAILASCFILSLICYPTISSAGSISVSGISSGGAMAIQYHVAYSSNVIGAGIIAGPPYWCANSNIANAVVACMSHPELISVTELVGATNYAYLMGSIDHPSGLENTKVWIYSGTQDSVVVQGVVKKTLEYYQSFMPSSQITSVFNYTSEHAFITAKYGNNCSYLGTPFINNCGLDSAGAILEWIMGPLKSPKTANSNNFVQLHQPDFIPVVGADIASMAEYAYAYIPPACVKADCDIHIVFHGCEQSITYIGDVFYMNAGYNEWAEANSFIVFYPQAKANTLNPNGCWDWWGFTGADYATKLGVQMVTVKSMVDYIAKHGTNATHHAIFKQ